MRSEDQMLRDVVRWAKDAEIVYPCLALLYHIPNEGRRTPREGRRAKLEGLKPGVPDLHLPVAAGDFHGLWIELKTPAGKLTDHQQRWIGMLAEYGHATRICRSFHEARTAIENYLDKGV